MWCRGKVVEIRDNKYLVTILDSGHNAWHPKV